MKASRTCKQSEATLPRRRKKRVAGDRVLMQERPAGREFVRRLFLHANGDMVKLASYIVATFIAVLSCANAAYALDAQMVAKLGAEEVGPKIEAVNALVASGDEAALALLLAVQAGD